MAKARERVNCVKFTQEGTVGETSCVAPGSYTEAFRALSERPRSEVKFTIGLLRAYPNNHSEGIR